MLMASTTSIDAPWPADEVVLVALAEAVLEVIVVLVTDPDVVVDDALAELVVEVEGIDVRVKERDVLVAARAQKRFARDSPEERLLGQLCARHAERLFAKVVELQQMIVI